MTGFGLDSSDIDMCLLLRPSSEDHRLDAVHQLHHIKNYLLKYGKMEIMFWLKMYGIKKVRSNYYYSKVSL